MRLYISTLTKRFVQSAAYTAPVTEFIFKRRDIEPIELYFLNESGAVEIPAKFLGKAILVAGSRDEFNGKYLPSGSIENGKPVWDKSGNLIKRVAALTYPIAAVVVSDAPSYLFNGTYLPDGVLNGKTRYKHTTNQNRFEWKPAETVLGSGVQLVGESSLAGLYIPDGTANGKPRYRRTGVGQISWKPQWQSISSDDLTVSNMQVYGVYFDGSYKRAPTPFNGRPRYYKHAPTSPTLILSSIQFESAYSVLTEDVQGSGDHITMLTATSGHFSLNLNGRFYKTTGNNVPNIGSSVDKWTLNNNDAYIVARPAGTYTNPYRLNLPNIGYTTSGSYLGGTNWYLDDTPYNGQPQWYIGSSNNPLCFLRYDDPTNRKWRFIQMVSGTNTPLAELTVPDADKTPIGKVESVVVSGAGTSPYVNGTYIRDGEKNGKPKYSKADGAHIAWHTLTTNGVTSACWYISTHPVYIGDGSTSNDAHLRYTSQSNVATPDLATNWITAGTPGTSGPPPQSITLQSGWVKLHSNFNEVNLNAAGGIKNDQWVISEEHWVLLTPKTQSGGLVLDSYGQNPLAWTLKLGTTFPASYAGEGDDLAWRSYADGSYGWETSKITDQIPDRWVARQIGMTSADGLGGWDGSIMFYTTNTAQNVWETSGWRRSESETIGASIQRQTLTNPARWLLHEENNINNVYYQAVVPADVPYGPWLDGNGDSFDDQWTADPNGQASGQSELSSYRQSTNFQARWSLGSDTYYSQTNSTSPWQATNWNTPDGTPIDISLSQGQQTRAAHWGLFTPDGEEQYAAFDSPDSPIGATWEDSANDNPPESTTEVDDFAPLEGKLAIKKNLHFDGPILAESSTWTELPASKSYSFHFNLNTAEIDAEFEDEPESIDGMIELTWSSMGAVSSSFTLPVKIYNDVIRGHEGPPSPPRSSLLSEMTGIAIVFGS
jgi:hypothetical protein